MQLITTSPRDVIGSETITVDTTAGGVALTATKYRVAGPGGMNHDAKEAFITVEDQPIRWKVDPAVTVTATTNGHGANAGDVFSIHGQQIVNFRAIRTGGVSATIRVTYFG
jgi:hypothetical protein